MPHRRLFYRLDELRLIKWSYGSHRFLSKLVDLSHIVTIVLGISYDSLSDEQTVTDICILLNQVPNLYSLKFLPSCVTSRHETALKNICLMVPPRVKHI